MSKLLKEALIDAKAIKDAALKSAENMILERFSPDVKREVEKLLNEEIKATEETPSPVSFNSLDDGPTSEKDTFSDVPSAVADGERLCRCPDEEEEIEINLPELAKQVGGDLQEMESDLGLDMPMGGDEASPLDNELPPPEDGEEEELIKELLQNEDIVGMIETELDSEVEENEETRDELSKEKKLEVDVEKTYQPLGHMGGANVSDKKGELARHAAGKSDDTQQDKEEEEEIKENKQLKESLSKNSVLTEKLAKTEKENKKLKDKFLALESLTKKIADKAEEINLRNAKLTYENKVLTDKSLNEKQRVQIAESLQRTKSVQEVKTVFETLTSAVNSMSEKTKEIKSLNEAVNSNTARVIQARQESDVISETVKRRMQRLAGISSKDE